MFCGCNYCVIFSIAFAGKESFFSTLHRFFNNLKPTYHWTRSLSLLRQTENIKNTKPMPQNRFRETFPLGFKESERIPPGRVSLVQAMKLLSDQQSSPAEWTVDRIASEYKIKSQLASTTFRQSQQHIWAAFGCVDK